MAHLNKNRVHFGGFRERAVPGELSDLMVLNATFALFWRIFLASLDLAVLLCCDWRKPSRLIFNDPKNLPAKKSES